MSSEWNRPSLFDLDGRVCLVAGGAGYLGVPVCEGLAASGATVVIADIDSERCAQAASALSARYSPERVEGVMLDVSQERSIGEVVDRVASRTGRIDVLVNATFWSTAKRLEELSGEEFERANRVNITSSFLLAREVATRMGSGGSIIFYSSMYGLISPNPGDYQEGMPPNPIEYGVGKAGIVQLVRYLAGHYGSKRIRVNAIAPGAFPHDSVRATSPDFVARLARKSMLGRLGRRGETAGPAVFLASDASSFVTGQVLAVDGGITAW